MLVFGHTGITLAAAVLLNGVLVKSHTLATRANQPEEQPQPLPGKAYRQNCSSGTVASWFISLADRTDIRLVLIGSLLPDIIDKPIGHFLFRETFSNGTIFSHTLLFLIIITIGGLYLYRSYNKSWLLALSFGTFTHLILDLMWLNPRTLLWPLYGLSFQRIDISQWLQGLLHTLLSNPVVGIPELMGVAVVIWFVLVLVRRGRLYTFIRHGRV